VIGTAPMSLKTVTEVARRLLGLQLNPLMARVLSRYEKVDLMGHSMGGMVAAYWVSQHTSDATRVNSVVTFESPLRGIGLSPGKLARQWLLNVGTACDANTQAWKDISTDTSQVLDEIQQAGALTDFFTTNATDLDWTATLIKDAKTRMANEVLHCQFKNTHSSLWESANPGLEAQCDGAFRVRHLGLFRGGSPRGDMKRDFVACAVTAVIPSNSDVCKQKL